MGKINILQGDIADQAVDAIVNAANNHLLMGTGVAGAIRIKGGPAIQEECTQKAPIAVGGAIETTAGNLKAKFVIHAATMGMDFKTSPKIVANATINSLKKAVELKLKSVAFPALGTGLGGFPVEECAKIMLYGVKKFLSENKALDEVRLVLFDKNSFEVFKKEFENLK
ncbi:MAG: hypothetical protein A2145_02390 [candidate division Zixibacteria bacterium RBG_16_40_9]|nr:MAG: hypothetical protein A2145_02390 [candidate division Zixibacteria bacterium RBG_16_40_9]